MKSFLALPMVLALSLCQPADDPVETGLDGYDPNLVANERSACETRGGTFGQGGIAGRFVCFEQTGEGGKSCSSSSDCTSHCLARSRTCAPVTPIFGCQDVLTGAGAVTTLCVD